MTDRPPELPAPDTTESDPPVSAGAARPTGTQAGPPGRAQVASATRSRWRPRSTAAWATVVLATTFAMLWTVFAIRAVDRNNDPTPTIALPPPTTTPNLQATVEFVNRRLFPDRPYPSRVATPFGTPVASTAVSSPAPPDATPLASPATEPVARP